jgi:hypothetical protein
MFKIVITHPNRKDHPVPPTVNEIHRMNRPQLISAIKVHPRHVFPQTGLSKWTHDELVRTYSALVGVDPDLDEL